MKYIKNTFITLTVIVSLLTSSCTDNFSKINAKIDGVTENEMSGDNFKIGSSYPRIEALVVPADASGYFQHQENLCGDVYGRFMMSNAKWKGGNLSEFSYQHNGWIDNCFNLITDFYPAWRDIVKDTHAEGVNYAWAVILRVSIMHRLTDIFGPIPYSKIDSGNLFVPYDSQEEVYKKMLKELSDAIQTLSVYHHANPSATPMKAYDRVYGGDFGKWIKYGNSLILRMAIRMRFAEPDLARKYAEEAVNNTVGVITDNADNAAYQPTGNNMLWLVVEGWNDAKACADITSYMEGYNDPRRERYFTESTFDQKGFKGLRAATNTSDDAYKKYSKPRIGQTDKSLWLTAAEVYFLRAEGSMLGWEMKGSAKELYEEGIRHSFDQWGAGSADGYIQDGKSKPTDYLDPNGSAESAEAVSKITIKWDDNANDEEKLERIITQKWIALWPLGHEAWCEHRRTGYPRFFDLVRPVQTIYKSMKVANRLPFARAEYDNNHDNVLKAVQLLGGPDNFATKMWWQAKP